MKLAFFLVILVGAQAWAEAQPGIWDQLQTGSRTAIRGKIKSLNVRANSVEIVLTVGARASTPSLKLCTEIASASADNDFFRSEEQRAAFFHQRMESLREAYRSGQIVELGTRGPWNPCVDSVQITSDESRFK